MGGVDLNLISNEDSWRFLEFWILGVSDISSFWDALKYSLLSEWINRIRNNFE